MFTLNPDQWNDGPAPLLDFMGSEGAPRIARRHLCQGGDSGGGADQAPDYGPYVRAMTEVGQKGLDRSQSLFDWATKAGVDLSDIAHSVGAKATAAADRQQGMADDQMDEWQRLYKPLYQAQAADASRMYADLPAYQEQQAGKAGADAATAIDQGMQSQMRNMRAQGFNPNAVAMGQIGATAATGRALATTQAAMAGREAAKNEARGVATNALQTGQQIPAVAGQQAQLAAGNRGQAVAAPSQAIQTTAGAQAPGMGYFNSAFPYFAETGKMMQTQEQARQAQLSRDSESDGGIMSTLLPLAGGIAGSFLMPGIGTGIGSAIGGAASKGITMARGSSTSLIAEGGRIKGRRYAAGGAIDTSPPMNGGNLVPPEASPSGGDEVDDVPAMVSEGEFVIPKRTVDWLGDKFFQKLIQKTDMEIEQDTTAAPEEGQGPPPDAPPTPAFRSEGARV